MTEYLLDHQWMCIRHIPVPNPSGSFAVQIGFPADLSMFAISLTAPPHCSQVSMSMLKTRLSLCAQVIDWCFCARVFSCPVGKACLALFRKAGVIVTRCRHGRVFLVDSAPWLILTYMDSQYNLIGNTLTTAEKVLLLAHELRSRLTSLVANWIRVGFCQGNFNSDNCAVGGFTLDYGPFGFCDVYMIHTSNHGPVEAIISRL